MPASDNPTGCALRSLQSYWPLVVPLVWCGVLLAFLRPDAVKARADIPYVLKWLVYDESDLAALALRGANVHAGRLPGTLSEPDGPGICTVDELKRRLDRPQVAYTDRFYLEYPTAALALFELGYLVQSNVVPPPPAVADSQHFGMAFFEPRTDGERVLWTQFRIAVQCYVVMMAAGLVGFILVQRKSGGPVWLLILPGAVYFSLNRFDVLPTLAVAGCFLALARGRTGSAGALLALGVLLKVFPVLFVPILLRYLGVRKGLIFLAAFAGVIFAGLGISWAVLEWESTIGPIRVQMSRELVENNWSLYGYVLPLELADWKLVRQALLVGAVLAAVITRPRDLDAVRRRCALVLVLFVFIAVYWSPQWFLWFLPLTVPLARRWPVKFAVISLDAANYFSFPILFWNLVNLADDDFGSAVVTGMIYVRAATWIGLAVSLVWDAVRKPDFTGPMAAYASVAASLRGQFLQTAAATGMPRGLKWLTAEPLGEPIFVRDRASKNLLALVPLLVQFEPLPGSDLEDVPQAREPRAITAIMTFMDEKWTASGRAIFNLTPTQVAAQNRYEPVIAASTK